MTTSNAERLKAAALNVRVARARLLLQLARDGGELDDLQQMARVLGDGAPAVDSLPAFQSAMREELECAQAELAALGPEPE